MSQSQPDFERLEALLRTVDWYWMPADREPQVISDLRDALVQALIHGTESAKRAIETWDRYAPEGYVLRVRSLRLAWDTHPGDWFTRIRGAQVHMCLDPGSIKALNPRDPSLMYVVNAFGVIRPLDPNTVVIRRPRVMVLDTQASVVDLAKRIMAQETRTDIEFTDEFDPLCGLHSQHTNDPDFTCQ